MGTGEYICINLACNMNCKSESKLEGACSRIFFEPATTALDHTRGCLLEQAVPCILTF